MVWTELVEPCGTPSTLPGWVVAVLILLASVRQTVLFVREVVLVMFPNKTNTRTTPRKRRGAR